MIINNYGDISYLQFSNFVQFNNIKHGIFLRKGGFSQPPFDSLNVSFNVGDNKENVIKNRSLVLQCFNLKNFISIKQVHGTDVLIIKKGINDSDNIIDNSIEADAIITDISDKGIVIQVADCQPIIVYDPVHKVIANIHSGWRGSINNIIGVTLNKMKDIFGCQISDIFAGVGPSLGPCCLEFINYEQEIPEMFWKYKINNYNFDFWSLSYEQLIKAGVSPDKIFISKICTRCNLDMFFSYRSNNITGRFASFICL